MPDDAVLLDDVMGDLDYPETAPVVDRQTLDRLADLEKEIQVFRGLRHLWSQSAHLNRDDSEQNYFLRASNRQIWQIVYFALRLFDHAYPNAAKTPHLKFVPSVFGDRMEQIQLSIDLEDALVESDNLAVRQAAQALLSALRPPR